MTGAVAQWIVLGVLTAGLLALLLPPLLRSRGQDSYGYDVAIYRDQLAEVLRDRERGLLDEDDASAAQREIERRLLAADAAARARTGRAVAPHWVMAVIIALALPVAAVPLYLQLGSPGLPDQPLAARAPAVPDDRAVASIEAMVARLTEQPDNGPGWAELGRELLIAGRYDDAVGALERALALTDDNPAVAALYGEAQVLSADGFVTDGARAAFNIVLAANAADPRARFYMALGTYQSGRREQALADWLALAADAPAGAPWLAEVENRIRAVAQELGRDPETVLAQVPQPPAPSGPTADAVAAFQQLSPEDQRLRIEAMVDGLETRLNDAPDDLEGWRMLGRARLNQGDAAAAAAAYGRASDLAPERVDLLLDWGMALIAAADGGVSADTLGLFDRVLALEPENPDALWISGIAALQGGDREVALARWRHLSTLLAADSPEQEIVKQAIAAASGS